MNPDSNLITQRYQLLVDSEDMVTISTPDRVRKFVNRSYCDFFGLPSSELVGKKFTDEFSDEKRKFYDEFVQQMTPENPSISTVQVTGTLGNQRYIHWKETGLYDDNGQLLEVISVGRDIDEAMRMKKDKENLLKILDAYRTAIDQNIICTITDAKGIITYANKRFLEVSQYTLQELKGRTHNIVNSGFHSKSFFANLWQTLLEGKIWSGEICNRAKDGSLYWVNSVILPIKEATGEITGFFSLRILVNEQKKLELEKNEYIHALEDMLNAISHDLRKPITSCQGILNLMRIQMPEKSEYNDMVSHLLDSAMELDYFSRELNDELTEKLKRRA